MHIDNVSEISNITSPRCGHQSYREYKHPINKKWHCYFLDMVCFRGIGVLKPTHIQTWDICSFTLSGFTCTLLIWFLYSFVETAIRSVCLALPHMRVVGLSAKYSFHVLVKSLRKQSCKLDGRGQHVASAEAADGRCGVKVIWPRLWAAYVWCQMKLWTVVNGHEVSCQSVKKWLWCMLLKNFNKFYEKFNTKF